MKLNFFSRELQANVKECKADVKELQANIIELKKDIDKALADLNKAREEQIRQQRIIEKLLTLVSSK